MARRSNSASPEAVSSEAEATETLSVSEPGSSGPDSAGPEVTSSQAPATPVLADGQASGNKVVPGGSKVFNLTPVDQVTFEAELDPESTGKGRVEVYGTTVTYTAHTPDATESVVIKVKAKNSSNEYSAATLDLTVDVVVTTLEVAPQTSAITVGSEDVEVTATTNAASITAESDHQEFLTVQVQDKKVILHPVAEGTATVTVKATADGGAEKTVSWSVNVAAQVLPEAEFVIDPTNVTIYGTGTMDIIVAGDIDSIEAESQNPYNVTVESQSTDKIQIKGVAPGVANINITGKKAGKRDKTIVLPVTVKEETTLTVTPNSDITVYQGDKQVFEVETNAADFNMESLTPHLASVDKASKSITVLAESGTAQIKFTAQKDGSNMKTVTVDVTCKAKLATKPVLESEVLEIDGGEILELQYNVAEGDTLSASIKENAKGSVKVIGNRVQYTAHKVVSEDKVTIVVKTTRGNSTSEELETQVTVKTSQAVKRPVLLTTNKYVESGKTKVFSFVVTEGSTLVLVTPSVGSAVVKGNTVVITATEVPATQSIKVVVKATKLGFTDSTKLEFNVVVLAKGDTPPESEEDFPIRDLTLDELKGIMANSDIPLKDKMEIFKSRGPVEQRVIISKVADYCDKMAPKNGIVNPDFGASQNFDLLNVILEVVNFEDTERFKINFDMINAMFLTNNKEDDALHWVSVQRFDLQWKYGSRALTTYQNLVHIISTLCDLTTRPQLVDGIDFDKALDKTTTLINDVAKANIVGYYKS